MLWRTIIIAFFSLLVEQCAQAEELRWDGALLQEEKGCDAAHTALVQRSARSRSVRSQAPVHNSSAQPAYQDFFPHEPLLATARGDEATPEQQEMLVRLRSHLWSLVINDNPDGGQQAVLAALIAAGLLVLALAAFLVLQAAASSELFSSKGKRLPAKPSASAAGSRQSLKPTPTPATSQQLRAPGSVADSRLPSFLKNASRSSSARGEFAGVPIMCPELIMPTMTTGLAVPVVPLHLQDSDFLFDVLGLSGTPLLTAAASITNGGKRCIEIRLHDVGTRLAVVTQDLRILTGDDVLVGSLLATPAGTYPPGAEDRVQYVLRDTSGHKVLSIHQGRSLREMEMTALFPDGTQDRELAHVTRRPPGNLPAEHYELVANPNTDAVLLLSCFLAISLFAMPLSMQSPNRTFYMPNTQSQVTLLPVSDSRLA